MGDSRVTRIAVFYDGNYFGKVSDYYRYQNPRQRRLSFDGIHSFIRSEVAAEEQTLERNCQIVETHWFRGRFLTPSMMDKYTDDQERLRRLIGERSFQDIVVSTGIVQHEYPIATDESSGRSVEKGIDVWLSLEAYDLAVHKHLDVLALVACDGDYVPLVRKLNGIGTRVMLLSWDFSYETTFNGVSRTHVTKTSQSLISEASHVLPMHDIIAGPRPEQVDRVNNLFV
ncbi:MAG: NYN domain-containing protein [Symbiobacteriia bacterium]